MTTVNIPPPKFITMPFSKTSRRLQSVTASVLPLSVEK